MNSVQSLIDNALAQKEARVRSGKFSPSSFGKCWRAQYWNRKNEPQSNPPDERSLRVFRAGHLFHDFVQGLLIKEYPDIKKEVLVENEDVKGFADLVNADEVIDIKSQHSKSFWYMTEAQKYGKDILEEKKPNALQLTFYAMMLGLPRCRLVFISKDDLCIQEVAFPTDRFRGDVESELLELREFWTRGDLPPAIPRTYGGPESLTKYANDGRPKGIPKECSYCGWTTKCFKRQEEEKYGQVLSDALESNLGPRGGSQTGSPCPENRQTESTGDPRRDLASNLSGGTR